VRNGIYYCDGCVLLGYEHSLILVPFHLLQLFVLEYYCRALDPGPRGVWLRDYSQELATLNDRRAPAGWTFNPNDWWLEEHGLIMEEPYFPLLAGRYLVTGGRLVTTGLTISENGSWRLDDGTLYDVTHLPCRSARYTPLENSATIGSPLTANPTDFPVAPGAIMPSVTGCQKQDYAVLFVVGKESPNKA
jgi:hypothetical protein